MKNLTSLLAIMFLAVVAVVGLGMLRQAYLATAGTHSENPAVVTTQASVSSEKAD